MEPNIDNIISNFDVLSIKLLNCFYTMSIVKETVQNKGNSGGIVIIGMVVVIVGLIGFILTKNKN
mgnify:CR=1 FL=1